MTIHEVATQLYRLSVGGYFNRQKWTRKSLEDYITTMLQGNNNPLVMEIALPDGWWYFQINHYGPRHDSFDYDLPDTREQEARIKSDFIRRYQAHTNK